MNNQINSNLSEKIISETPRMTTDDEFYFSCNPGISCFNKCCSDVNIFLTPYDIIRLKNRLGITSTEFLEKYTLLPIDENLRHPIVMFRMTDEKLSCPFVGENGCTVYSDRPWSCRMYPVGEATPNVGFEESPFYFLLKEDVCLGFDNKKRWTVREWMDDQGVKDYTELGEMFKEISLHEYFTGKKPIEPVKLEMFYMVCYDIDRFRSFVFDSTFLKRFYVDNLKIEKMKNDDSELLKFGFLWLRYSLFGEKLIDLRDEYMKPAVNL